MSTHYPWLVRITALEAYRGNPDDPLVWHFISSAGSVAEVLAETRKAHRLPEDTKIEIFPR